ncbi:GNAT family N-acetyltransferase [Roseibacterium sp. SDUM158017]|uniref:GNAT family N-acetyltransferase n=1 Tax=Roseicyclus salinarum TaxID=3036773 RepID=UPI002414F038|nr:GNAT family N-acetyltransferase [Roseibacterium sp. SDUM158017]MDG4648057.1 GNAT family N-acetyltransferase [Roseibacterium sp. SDUM158017]
MDGSTFFPALGALPDRPADTLPLQQTVTWLRALRLLGADVRPLQGTGLAGHAVMRRLPLLGDVAMISRGAGGLNAGQARGLRDALGARHLVVHADTPEDGLALRRAGFRRIAAPRLAASLAIAAPPAQLAARMEGKWRNRLRHGSRQGLVVRRRPLPADPRHWIFDTEARAARRLRYMPLPPQVIAAFCAADHGGGQLFVVMRGAERLAAMLFLRHGAGATYQIGWISDAGRRASAGNLCLWRAMLELRELGVTRIDLGAADARCAPGLARFKTGAGGIVRPMGGSWLDTACLPRARPLAAASPVAPEAALTLLR